MSDKNDIAEKLKSMSDNYIKEMYRLVEEAFKHDTELSDEQKEQFQRFHDDGVYYGTDIFSDWTEWKEMLEFEIDRRKLKI